MEGARVESKPWNQRRSSLQTFSYEDVSLSEALRCIISEVRSGVTEDAFPYRKVLKPIKSPFTTCMRALKTIGLVSYEVAKGWVLTPEAEQWLETNDDSYLVALICSNVQFTGELLYLLEEPKSESELFAIAKSDYGKRWNGVTQISERRKWFESLGLVERVGAGSFMLTASGREFLQTIEVTRPEDISDELKFDEQDTSWFPSDWAIDLCRMQAEESAARRLKIPPLTKGKEKLELFSKLIGFLEAPRSIYEYNEFLKQMGIEQGGIEGFRSVVNRFGLVRNGAAGYQSTENAVKWMKTGSRPIDFACYIHSRFAFTFEILQELLPGEKNYQELVNLAKVDYGVDIKIVNLTPRLHILALAGLVNLNRGKVGITPYGKRLVCHVLFETDRQRMVGPGENEQVHVDASSAALREITLELRDSAIDSSHPERFEIACMSAFKILGFAAEHIGKSDNTDVLIEGQVGTEASYRIAVETKSSASYNVDSDIKTDVLRKHREKHGAVHSLVIGAKFGKNTQQQEFAKDSDVALMSVDLLCYLLKLHDITPLSTREYEDLLNSNGLIKEDDIRKIFVPAHRNQCTISMVIRTLSTYSEMMSSDSMMSAESIRTAIMFSSNEGLVNGGWLPETKVIEEVCDLLSNSMIGVIEKKGNKYRLLGSTTDLSTKLSGYMEPRLLVDAELPRMSDFGYRHV